MLPRRLPMIGLVLALAACATEQTAPNLPPTALAKGDSLLGSLDDALIPKPKRPIEINARVPEMLDQLVMECVEVDPEDRPHMELVTDRLNLIRGKLEAEQILRKSNPGGLKGDSRDSVSRPGSGDENGKA